MEDPTDTSKDEKSKSKRGLRDSRTLVPEVIQTSGMDCGPACLKAFLDGFDTEVSYGRLREACQTDVDGTSIDALEEVAKRLGVDAEQVMVPVDHLLQPAAGTLPAIVVVQLPNGFTHFVVLWRVHFGGRVVQVMDPAKGRRWMTSRQFLEEIYVHRFNVPALGDEGWRGYAGKEEFQDPLKERMKALGVSGSDASKNIADADDDSGWESLAALDAAVRMTAALVDSGALRRGREAARCIERAYARAKDGRDQVVPDTYWSVRPARSFAERSAGAAGAEGEDAAPTNEDEEVSELELRGAVLVRGKGRKDRANPEDLPAELAAALTEQPLNPFRELGRLLREDGLLAPLAIIAAVALAATGVLTEALLFRGLLDLGAELRTFEQRVGLMAALLVFVVANRLLAWFAHRDSLGFGRRLEVRLRRDFLAKLPRLEHRYFGSRPVSDMAERAHSLVQIRGISEQGRTFFHYLFETLATCVGMAWLHPPMWPMVIVALICTMGIPLLFQPLVGEQDMRVRTHLGALAKYYLDAMLGLVAVRTHSAERTLRREHESLLGEWVGAKLNYLKLFITMDGVQIFLGIGCVIYITFDYIATSPSPGGLLLLVFWGVNLPFRGRMVVYTAVSYMSSRNVLARVLEPLGAPEERAEDGGAASPDEATAGVRIEMQGVQVVAAGNTILQGVDLTIEPGEHLGVVGSSGAGKTSLVSLLLGWHRAAHGEVLIDGTSLDLDHLDRLRRQTAWVDPAVQIWNRSLLENLRYGNAAPDGVSWGGIVEQAQLRKVLESLPEGFQTTLGESGGLVSGGEGQRVRLGRSLARPGVRLAILDEPFRGLGRGQRHELLERARELWAEQTLVCVTHDVAETRAFPRVLVVEDGRIVEDASPAELEANPESRYSVLLAAEERVGALWRGPKWRQLWLDQGRLEERAGPRAQSSAESAEAQS